MTIGYWTNFAATGNPDGPGPPDWPRYTPEAPAVQSLAADATHATNDHERRHQCKFWRQLGYNTLYDWAGGASPPPPQRAPKP